MPKYSKGGLVLTVILSLVLLTLSYIVFTHVPSPEYRYNPGEREKSYHPDEGVWTAAGKHYFQKFFLERDWSYETWKDPRFGAFGTSNPVMGKYLIGCSLFINGVVDFEQDIPGYEFENGFDWQVAESTKPPEDILKAARLPMKLAGMLCAVILFLLVRQLTASWVVGFCSSILFVFQPQVIVNCQQVLMDMPVLFFSLLTLFVCVIFIKQLWKNSLSQMIFKLAIIGFIFGFAIQTKLNSLLILLVVFGWMVVELCNTLNLSIFQALSGVLQTFTKIFNNTALRRKIIVGVITLALSIGFVFVSLNPYLYKDTLRNTKHLFSLGSRVTNMDVPEDYKNNTLVKRWNSLIYLGLDRSGVFSYWFGFSSIDKLLAFLGAMYSILAIFWARNPSEIQHGYILMGIWFLVVALGLFAWIPFRWPRWYIPMTPIWAVLEVLGFLMLFQIFKAFILKYKIHRRDLSTTNP